MRTLPLLVCLLVIHCVFFSSSMGRKRAAACTDPSCPKKKGKKCICVARPTPRRESSRQRNLTKQFIPSVDYESSGSCATHVPRGHGVVAPPRYNARGGARRRAVPRCRSDPMRVLADHPD